MAKKKLKEGKGELSIANKDGDKEGSNDIKELLEAYKLQNPKKYEFKKKRGEFDKYLKGKEKPAETQNIVAGDNKDK